MANSWIEVKLEEYLNFKNGKTSPARNDAECNPVYGSNGIIGYSKSKNAQKNSLIIGRVGTYCGSVFHTSNECWITDNAISCTPKFEGESEFWYFMLLNLNLNNHRTGSGQPLLNQSILKSISTKVSDQHEARKEVGEFLMTFNDKIELNQQTNQTLEKMAQALFKSWFVDFDPVIDNALAAGTNIGDFPEPLQKRAELRKAVQQSADVKKLPEDIQKLFPSEFEESELGWVPKGWVVKTIDELCYINPQAWNKKNAPDSVKYVDLANAKNGTVLDICEYTFEEAPSRARRILQPHDTIIGVVRPANRSFAYVNEVGLTGSTGFAVARPTKESYRTFSYLSLTNDDCIREFSRIADGAAYPAIKPDDVAKAQCIYSSDIVLAEFEKLAGSLMQKVAGNEQQSTPLKSLRDTLLPKLISGELKLTMEVA